MCTYKIMFTTGEQFVSHPWKDIEEIKQSIENKDTVFSNNVTNPYLFYWFSKKNWSEVSKWMLIRFKHEIHDLPYCINIAIEYAAIHGNIEYFIWLMDQNFVLNNNFDITFQSAIVQDQVEFCKMLLERNYIDRDIFAKGEKSLQNIIVNKCLSNNCITSLYWLYENFEMDFVDQESVYRYIVWSSTRHVNMIPYFDWFIRYYPYSIDEANSCFASMFETKISISLFQRMMEHYPHLEITDELFLRCNYYPIAEWIVSLFPDKYEVKTRRTVCGRRRREIVIPMLKDTTTTTENNTEEKRI